MARPLSRLYSILKNQPARKLRPAAPTRQPRLAVEELEGREVPAAVLATSYYDGALYSFNSDTGALLDTFLAPYQSALQAPGGLSVGPDKNAYISSQNNPLVSGSSNEAIFQYDFTTRTLGTFITHAQLQAVVNDSYWTNNGLFAPPVFGPTGQVWDSTGTHLYVSMSGGQSTSTSAVVRFDITNTGGVRSYAGTYTILATGNLTFDFGQSPPAVTGVTGVYQAGGLAFGTAVGDTNTLYVTALGATFTGQVFKIPNATTITGSVAAVGFTTPQGDSTKDDYINYASELAWGPDGKLYVVDLGATSDQGKVVSFKSDGSFDRWVTPKPSATGDLNQKYPADILFDGQGNFLIGNLGDGARTGYPPTTLGSIYRYGLDGTFQNAVVTSSQFPDTNPIFPGVYSGTSPTQLTLRPIIVNQSATALPANAASIIITGSGFDPTAANNTVTFNNGAFGTVTSASSTSLTVTFSTKPQAPGVLTAVVTTDGTPSGAAVQVAVVTPVVTANSAKLPITSNTVTINGFGFDSTAANNAVTFNNGAVGTVTAASATSLTVTFSTKPSGVGALTASVTSGGQSSGSAAQVATVSPVVTSATTNLAANANGVTIAGAGFSTTAANNTVVFNNGAIGTVTAATATSLTVTFSVKPRSAGSLTAVVTTNGVDSGSAVQVATVFPVVTISSANLSAGAATVTINGVGFDPTAANNTVVFNNGAVGTVTAASATSLTVTFSTKPTAVGNLTASVTSNGQSSGSAVQVATVIPAVTASTASRAVNATSLTINGFGFDPTAASNTVALSGGATGTVTAATGTRLTVTVSGLVLGNLTAVITTNGQSSGSAVQVATVVAAPTVTASTAPQQLTGSTVTITGTGFSTIPANNTVAFNLGAVGTVTAATATSLTVNFSTKPTTTGALTAVVTSNGGASGSPTQVATVTTPQMQNQTFVANAYQLLLGRTADASAAGWATALNNGTSLSSVVFGIQGSAEYLTRQVNALYTKYLGRSAGSEATGWVNYLVTGGTFEQMTVGLLSSAEYSLLHASNTAFVTALFQQVLGRTPVSSEVSSWVSLLNSGTTRASVATGFVFSLEYKQNLVRSYYTTYLGRPAETAGLNGWVSALSNGSTDQQVIAGIFGSSEAFAKWSV